MMVVPGLGSKGNLIFLFLKTFPSPWESYVPIPWESYISMGECENKIWIFFIPVNVTNLVHFLKLRIKYESVTFLNPKLRFPRIFKHFAKYTPPICETFEEADVSRDVNFTYPHGYPQVMPVTGRVLGKGFAPIGNGDEDFKYPFVKWEGDWDRYPCIRKYPT